MNGSKLLKTALVLICGLISPLFAGEGALDGPVEGTYVSSDLEYEKIDGDKALDEAQMASAAADSSLEFISSTLWSGIRGIQVDGNYAYCTFYILYFIIGGTKLFF